MLFNSFLKTSIGRSILKLPSKHFSSIQTNLIIEHLEGIQKGITVFTLNRPKEKNSFNTELITNLHNALTDITNADSARVLIVRSRVPNVFCAGADLKERATMPANQVNRFVSNLRQLMFRLHNLPIPTLTALDGIALGGGLELALSTDIRIGADNIKLGLVETKLAIIPGAGGTQYLPRLIGPSLAKELICTARVLDGPQAKQLDILNHLVPQNATGDAAYQKAIAIAEEILPNGPIAVKMAKMAVDRGLDVDLNTGLNIEQTCYAQLIPTKDRTEGLTAFREKRKPNYQGN